MTDEKKPPARDVVAWFDQCKAQLVIGEIIDGKQAREIRLDYYQVRLLVEAMSNPGLARYMLRRSARDSITRSLLDASQQELDDAKAWPTNSTK
ncbi:hypothetical protein [Kosakonia phage Kc166B]|nr:hypothetical protein [Kosakonia phage Kc237]QQV88695.1 hypothetical protein [Kosakonia phage Kc166B]